MFAPHEERVFQSRFSVQSATKMKSVIRNPSLNQCLFAYVTRYGWVNIRQYLLRLRRIIVKYYMVRICCVLHSRSRMYRAEWSFTYGNQGSVNCHLNISAISNLLWTRFNCFPFWRRIVCRAAYRQYSVFFLLFIYLFM